MKKFRFFRCKCGEQYEKLISDEVKEVECTCGLTAVRMLSAPKCFQNTTGRSPSAR